MPVRPKSIFATLAPARLVLVDGLRYVNGASASGVPGSTDLNAIPESAIERIEVLQDGASAIYGSDAIAGVVNIITKRRQAGFIASAQLGEYLDEGDGSTQNYQLSWGNGGTARCRSSSAANYVKQNPVFTADRALSAISRALHRCLSGDLFELYAEWPLHRVDLPWRQRRP